MTVFHPSIESFLISKGAVILLRLGWGVATVAQFHLKPLHAHLQPWKKIIPKKEQMIPKIIPRRLGPYLHQDPSHPVGYVLAGSAHPGKVWFACLHTAWCYLLTCPCLLLPVEAHQRILP